MLGEHLILCVIILLFVMGVKKVELLKCYSCDYKTMGTEEKGSEACKHLNSSVIRKEFLVNCGSYTKLCSSTTAQFSKRDSGEVPTHIWKRSCYTGAEEKTVGCSDADISDKLNGSGTVCYCKTDACNVSDGGSHPDGGGNPDGGGQAEPDGGSQAEKKKSSHGVTLSLTLMTLCVSWAVLVLRNFHHLF